MHVTSSQSAGRASHRQHTVFLASGVLKLALSKEEFPLEHLAGFACRRNPKRGFLFVSKVLGRHHAIDSSVPRRVAGRLADRLPTDLAGPVVFIGLAEMAVALGQLVHTEYARRTQRRDLLSIHSTRHRVLDDPLCFLERHSHAAQHYLHRPHGLEAQRLFETARTLVVVDDEITTGKTAVELGRLWQQACPHAETLWLTTPLCFASSEQMSTALDMPVNICALVEGTLDFEPDASWQSGAVPAVQTTNIDHTGTLRKDSARLGRADPSAITPEIAAIARSLHPQTGEKVLVLGSGEFTYEPLLLGEELSSLGAEVHLQAISRSPIHPGHAIHTVLELPDAYGENIQNFLYNADLSQYHRVILFQEAAHVDHRLADGLRRAGANLEIRTWNG